MNNRAEIQKQKELRNQAKERLVDNKPSERPPEDNDPRKLLHELHVHQVELEMQNEELRRAQLELEESRILYRDLYDLAPIGYCTLDDEGLILQANLTAATLLGVAREALVKQPIRRFIAKEDRIRFTATANRSLQQRGCTPAICA